MMVSHRAVAVAVSYVGVFARGVIAQTDGGPGDGGGITSALDASGSSASLASALSANSAASSTLAAYISSIPWTKQISYYADDLTGVTVGPTAWSELLDLWTRRESLFFVTVTNSAAITSLQAVQTSLSVYQNILSHLNEAPRSSDGKNPLDDFKTFDVPPGDATDGPVGGATGPTAAVSVTSSSTSAGAAAAATGMLASGVVAAAGVFVAAVIL